MSDFIQLVVYSTLLVQAAWAWRLWRLSLTGRYKGLILYLIGSTSWFLTAVYLDDLPRSPGTFSAFAWFYVLTRPLIWVLFFVVLAECLSHMVDRYPGVERVGKFVLYGALAASFVAVVVQELADGGDYTTARYWRRVCMIHDQSVYLGASACVVGLFIFRRFFSLPMPSNVAVIFGVFGSYFVGAAALFLVDLWGGSAVNSLPLVRIAGPVLYTGCLLIGVWRFSAHGEEVQTDSRLAQSPHPMQFQLAEQQLEQMNLRLMRVLAK